VTIIRKAWREEWEDHWLVYEGKEDGVKVYFFCNSKGIVEGGLAGQELIAWNDIQAHPEDYYKYVETCPQAYMHPTVVECCGQEIECPDFTNTCEICGADYNWNGSHLAPREQWGEETGEHPADIYRIR
jgi:hypothetical protein